MGAHPHDQFVPTWSDGLADVKDRGREAGQMLPDLCAIQPNRRAELRLVDAENGHAPQFRYVKRAVVPKPIAILVRDPGVKNDSALRLLAGADAILDQHPAIELVHMRKGWLRRVREARHWNPVFPCSRNGLR